MKRKWIMFVVLLILFAKGRIYGQTISDKTPADLFEAYERGSVWVKLKDTKRYAFEAAASGGRLAGGINAKQIRPLLNQHTRQKNATRMAPRKQRVDMSLYFKITFDADQPLADAIRSLYETGYFDLVEPIYTISTFLTPNDPLSDQQYYLDLIRASEAWDITTGDPSIIIGIVDTGGDLNHPDLQANVFIDPVDPIDGIDNDNDGYIDNNRGWDFSGADLATISDPGFIGDNDPSISQGGLFSHGTLVAGCASAVADNGIGISGIGFRTKLLFTKHYADNQSPSSTVYSSNLYEGMLYAATHGAKIINCSWGGYNRSTIAQDIIEYVTLDLGCLVVAAAGNSNLETPIYPASYEYVLSVANCNASDVRASFSNFGKTIDIISPGVGIFTTSFDDGYSTDSGTSLSAPIVSGAAALVWAQNPAYSPIQVAEQLRASADASIYDKNPSYLYKLGKGRLDVAAALTYQGPSIRARNQLLLTVDGEPPVAGEAAKLYFNFTNYLHPSSTALVATLTSLSPFVTIIKDNFALGSLGENVSVSNNNSPFEIILSADFPMDQSVEALLTFSDGLYQDFQLITFTVPSYIDLDENNIITSITASGRIGFGNPGTQTIGSGFIYNEESLLYEMGLIMGTSPTALYNNVRGINGEYDQDFTPMSNLERLSPGSRANVEIIGGLQNDPDPSLASLSITHQSLAWVDIPYRNFVILEYTITNTSALPVDDFYFGIFADWDIESGGGADRAGWETETRLGYVFPAQSAVLPRAGIQELTGNPQYYAIDNDPSIAGNPFGTYDGFTDVEKFTSLSSGQSKVQAGNPSTGGDVSHVVASGPYSIAVGESVTIAFALHSANSMAALVNSAKYADSLYNFVLPAPRPIVDPITACIGDPAQLLATGVTKYKWYTDFTGGSAIYEGDRLDISMISADTVLFVSNADEKYESVRTRALVSAVPKPVILASGSLLLCEGQSVVLSVGQADEYFWSTGEDTRQIVAASAGEYSVSVRHAEATCAADQSVIVVVQPNPDASFILQPEKAAPGEPIKFVPNEPNGATWRWDFGDGSTSTEMSPNYTYTLEGDYTVSLQLTTSGGCIGEGTYALGVITDIEHALPGMSVYPNPTRKDESILSIAIPLGGTTINLLDAQGKRVLVSQYTEGEQLTIDTANLANGIYLLTISTAQHKWVRKIVIAR